MFSALPLLVFTDLDGTLIEHDSYSWAPARPALDALRRIGAGVVMASSKTAPEIASLQSDLDLKQWPAIVENGAGLLSSKAATQGADYDALRAALDTVPKPLRAHYRGFGDMSVSEVARITGLPVDAATLACCRSFSEPGLWDGSDGDLQDFLAALREAGVFAREGGRFLTLSFGATKADRIAGITAELKPRYTVSLGDAPNDLEMLEATDFGVIVANPHRAPLPPLEGETTGKITRTTLPGPSGWNAAILELIARLELE